MNVKPVIRLTYGILSCSFLCIVVPETNKTGVFNILSGVNIDLFYAEKTTLIVKCLLS